MARGRKAGPSRLDRRREAEAAEAQESEQLEVEEEEEAEEEAEEEEEEAAEETDEGEDEEEGGKKKKKVAKKKAAPKVKKPATKRVRTPKEVRQKAVWVVFDNSSKRVDSFPFNEKEKAEALLARKIQEKEGKATFYLNLVKEPIE